ncbi:MAG TPA: helix-turn-helix transcriptional regulator [Tepidisphaeraceae bacterium]
MRAAQNRALHEEADLEGQERTFASKLDQLMKKHGMTQAELAEKTDVNQPAIANMLSRECRPQRRTIAKLAAAFGVEPEELWPFKD